MTGVSSEICLAIAVPEVNITVTDADEEEGGETVEVMLLDTGAVCAVGQLDNVTITVTDLVSLVFSDSFENQHLLQLFSCS